MLRLHRRIRFRIRHIGANTLYWSVFALLKTAASHSVLHVVFCVYTGIGLVKRHCDILLQ